MTTTAPEQDPDYYERCYRRLLVGLKAVAGRQTPISIQELQDASAAAVTMTEYDLSPTKTGSIRAWVNFGWNLSGFQNAGWLLMADSGIRASTEGVDAATRFDDPAELMAETDKRYKVWDAARKEDLSAAASDPAKAIAHPGSAAAHATRAATTVLRGLKDSSSAFAPGTPAWSPEATSSLARYVHSTTGPRPASLEDIDDDHARLLAAEGLSLLLAPFADLAGTFKRRRIRNSLMFHASPPPIPTQISADLEHGFVRGGKRLAADPISLLRALSTFLEHWWSLPH